MTRASFADQLQAASDMIGDTPRHELQVLLRRAALRLRNTDQIPLDPEWEDALRTVATEIGLPRNELIRRIVQDWLVANSWLPAGMLEEDSETEGEA